MSYESGKLHLQAQIAYHKHIPIKYHFYYMSCSTLSPDAKRAYIYFCWFLQIEKRVPLYRNEKWFREVLGLDKETFQSVIYELMKPHEVERFLNRERHLLPHKPMELIGGLIDMDKGAFQDFLSKDLNPKALLLPANLLDLYAALNQRGYETFELSYISKFLGRKTYLHEFEELQDRGYINFQRVKKGSRSFHISLNHLPEPKELVEIV